LNGDMSHCGRRRSAVPMLLVRRKPDHITRPDFLNRPAPTLRPPNARRDDQRLTEWMRVPGGASTRIERDACATNTCRFGCLEQRVNPNCPGKIFGRSLSGTLRTRSFYLHLLNVVVSDSHSTLNFSAHCGNSVPACSAIMYLAYQSGQLASLSPVRFSCSP